MNVPGLMLSLCVVAACLGLGSALRAKLRHWRFAALTRELAIRWRLLDRERKLGVLKALGVLTICRVPAPGLDDLYEGVLAGARAALHDESDLAEIEMHLRMAFARYQGDGRSRALVI